MTATPPLDWHRTPWGWSAIGRTGIRWTLRHAPAFAVAGRGTRRPPHVWIYCNGSRYTPTGRFADAVSLPSMAAAKSLAEGLDMRRAL